MRDDKREMLSEDSSTPCDNDHSLRTGNKSNGGDGGKSLSGFPPAVDTQAAGLKPDVAQAV